MIMHVVKEPLNSQIFGWEMHQYFLLIRLKERNIFLEFETHTNTWNQDGVVFVYKRKCVCGMTVCGGSFSISLKYLLKLLVLK